MDDDAGLRGPSPSAVVDAQYGAPGRTPITGQTYEAWWPFRRVNVHGYDEEGGYEFESWAPGWEYEAYGPEDSRPVWAGEGAELRTVVATFRPGRFPERVFYTRQWRDPTGKVFGKGGLHITTATAFRRWAADGLRERFEALCREYRASRDGGAPSPSTTHSGDTPA